MSTASPPSSSSSSGAGTYPTVLEKLSHWAATSPDKEAWTFLDDKGLVTDRYTYLQLERATTHLAATLLDKHTLRNNDRVLLVFFPGLDFTVTLLACFKAGLVAVPVFPPDPRRLKKDLHHFISIQTNSGAKHVLTHGAYNFAKKITDLKRMFSASSDVAWPELNWIQVDDVLAKAKARAVTSAVAKGELSYHKADYYKQCAFLQYTSGSTSEPKGVIITHESLSHNLKTIIQELNANETTHNVSWLPQYHDMGLIGSYLGAIYCGGKGYYISPISFLKDPTLWVHAMSVYRATHTQAPNFAYALVVRKYLENKSNPNMQKLNLSSLQHMINAAEPVDYFAIQRFFEVFIPHGLPSSVVFPTYGLAEHTVFVCSGGNQVISVPKISLESGQVQVVDNRFLGGISDDIRANNGKCSEAGVPPSFRDVHNLVVVGCGYPDRGDLVDVKITDQEAHTELPDLVVGEIWVTSPSKSIGYWGHSVEDNNADFHAQLETASSGSESISSRPAGAPDGYLRTGDLGFKYNGELFICGRSKDLIIIRGSNHYPQDIEKTSESVAAAHIRPGCSAAFAVRREQDDTEIIVYVAELKEKVPSAEYAGICHAVKTAIATEHGVALTIILLLATRSIPKTTSGKIARSWCKRGYLNKSLTVLHMWEGSATLDPSSLLPDESSGGGAEKAHTTSAGAADVTEAAVLFEGEGDAILSPETLRALPLSEIAARLEATLVRVAYTSPNQISGPVDHKVALISLGMDSMTIVQFKGVLENRFHSTIPDEFLFTNICTLESLAEAVKRGSLTEEQQKLLESSKASPDPNSLEERENGVVVVGNNEPCCPWFYCCY